MLLLQGELFFYVGFCFVDRDRRPKSRDRERNDRFDRNKFGPEKSRGDRRRTKWDTNDKLNTSIGVENMATHGKFF